MSRKASIQAEDFVSKEHFKETLENQEKMFKDLMNLQEKNFRTFLECFMEATNKRVDSFIKDVSVDLANVKHSIEHTQKDVDDINVKVKESTVQLGEIKKETEALDLQLQTMLKQVDYIDNQGRRNNLRFDGINETPTETWEQTEIKVKDLLSAKLQLDPTNVEIDRAHRIGSRFGDKPRTIVARFLKYKDKSNILTNAKKLKGTGVFINEDFSDRVAKIRKDLWPRVKDEREKGNIAYINFDRLVVKPRS